MRMKKVILTILLAAGFATGCGTGSGSDASAKTDAETNAPSDDAAQENTLPDNAGGTTDQADVSGDADQKNASSDRNGEKTEIRREKYDDCDGSGHGYVEIYYSDGSMETEEY